METRFLVVPQWQGSGSSRAMRLIDGANAIAGDLPAGATTVVEVPLEAGEALETGVHRYSAIVMVRDRARESLKWLETAHPGSMVITVGGDGGADLAGVGHAVAAHPDAALVWFDAHAALNTVESSPSGAFHGMVVRTLVGDGVGELAAGPRIDPSRVVLAGTRAWDAGEREFANQAGIRMLEVDELSDPQAAVRAVEATAARQVYVHVDLDVLDPPAIEGIGFPEPFGVLPGPLCDAIRALCARFELVGAGVTEFAPQSPTAAENDLPVILRVLGALTGPRRH